MQTTAYEVVGSLAGTGICIGDSMAGPLTRLLPRLLTSNLTETGLSGRALTVQALRAGRSALTGSLKGGSTKVGSRLHAGSNLGKTGLSGRALTVQAPVSDTHLTPPTNRGV